MQTPSVPFRPGYALGSIIPLEEMETMLEEAKLTGRIENYETQLRKIKSIRDEMSSRGMPISALEELKRTERELKRMKLIAQLTYFDYISNNATGIANKFQCNIESPIDWARSKLVSMPRGFDTLNFNSTYVMSDEKNQKINDMVDQLSGGVSYSSFFVSANISGSISKRVRNASSTGKTEGSLVIGSFATTRHVRTFERLYYDTDKLRALKEHIQREKKATKNTCRRKKIQRTREKEKSRRNVDTYRQREGTKKKNGKTSRN